MEFEINIEERKPIWIALSYFYLDTELEKNHYDYVTKVFSESSFSIDKIKWINRHEVFPVLYGNLFGVAGIWNGFDEEWLANKIVGILKKKRRLVRLGDAIFYTWLKSSFTDHWIEVEKELSKT